MTGAQTLLHALSPEEMLYKIKGSNNQIWYDKVPQNSRAKAIPAPSEKRRAAGLPDALAAMILSLHINQMEAGCIKLNLQLNKTLLMKCPFESKNLLPDIHRLI